jgi:putative ABC transport system permease protein
MQAEVDMRAIATYLWPPRFGEAWRCLRQGMAITLGGITLGLAAALASTRVMTALLYEVTPTDFETFAAAVATVGATAFAACCGPAVKASLIDPLVALRWE